MSESLPLRANLEWLRTLAKERLDELRARDAHATLSDAQLAVARQYGFASWRAMKARVDDVRERLHALVPDIAALQRKAEQVEPRDPELVELLEKAARGDLARVTELLSRRPELVRAPGPEGQTVLHVAAECNDNRLAVYLAACGADLGARYGDSGHTPLSWAVTCNARECALTLLRLGAKPDLFCAAGLGSLEHVRGFFDEAGALRPGAATTGSTRLGPGGTRLPCPPEKAVEQVSDALYAACRNGQAEVVRFLLTKGPDLAFRAYMGGTPLHWAYFGGAREVIELLLSAGADAQARDARLGCTPRAFGICAPASWGFVELVRRQLAADPELARFMDGKTSALHEAARAGQVEVIRVLVQAGADRTLRDGAGRTARDVAEASGHAAAVSETQAP